MDDAEAADVLSAILSDHHLSEIAFEKIRVVYHTPESILVPNAFYTEDSGTHFLHWQNGEAGNYFPMKDALHKAQIQLLYAVPESLHHIIISHFPNAEFVHAHSAAITTGCSSEHPTILIDVYPNEWICSFWNKSKLQLIRSVVPVSADDLAYNVVNICNQLQMPLAECKTIIGGLIDKNDAFISGLSRFLENNSWTVSAQTSEYPTHYFTSIINRSLCEL